jgi:hypothetical protein
MQCHFFIFFKKNEKVQLGDITKWYEDTFFFVLLQFFLIIKKLKAKFLVCENKYVCRYCKI